MTDAAPLSDAPSARFTRRAECWLAGIGLTLAAVLQGGFALAVSRADDDVLATVILPAADAAGIPLPSDGAHELLGALAGWFGFSLIAIAAACAIGFFFASRRPRRRSTGWWFLAAGLACLFGTQLMLYPVAFFFFAAAGLFAVRAPRPGSPA